MKTCARILLIALLVTPFGACKKDSNAPAKDTGTTAGKKDAPPPATTGPGSASGSATGSAAPAAGAITDAQIAQIVVTANQIDIDAGKAAKAKTKNDDVAKFADTMIADHGKINDAATALVTKLGVTPEPSDTSRGLEAQAKATADKMSGLDGTDFDKAYVANEVTYHQQVLDALDKVLIPGAQNAELKQALEGARPIVAEHLDHAKMIQANLK